MSGRQYNEERYKKQQIEGDDLHNAAVCDQIADESLKWNPSEAVHWRKLAVEHAEKYYGKNKAEDAAYYEKLANDYFHGKASYSPALKWNSKARKIKAAQFGEYAPELLENELLELRLYYCMNKQDEMSTARERIKVLLEKNPDCEEPVLYKAYLYMAQYKKHDGNLEFADAAMRIAEKVYGEISVETAEVYRIRAIELWYSAEEGDLERKKEAVEWNNKAYYIVTHAKNNGQSFDVLRGIERNMQVMRLPDELSYEELRARVDKMLADNSEDDVSEQNRNAGRDEEPGQSKNDSGKEASGQSVNDSEDVKPEKNRNAGRDEEPGQSKNDNGKEASGQSISDSKREMPPELEEKLESLYEKGNRLEQEERYEEALQAWQEGYALIPAGSRPDLEAACQFLAAMGDVYFLRKGMYQEAYECFDTARGYGGYGSPFIMLRLGECCLELGDEKNAAEYLMRAWMMEGEEIFEPDENGEDDGSKYYEFLRTHVDL